MKICELKTNKGGMILCLITFIVHIGVLQKFVVGWKFKSSGIRLYLQVYICAATDNEL